MTRKYSIIPPPSYASLFPCPLPPSYSSLSLHTLFPPLLNWFTPTHPNSNLTQIPPSVFKIFQQWLYHTQDTASLQLNPPLHAMLPEWSG